MQSYFLDSLDSLDYCRNAISQKSWKLSSDQAMSMRIFSQKEADNIFFYQEQNVGNGVPFVTGMLSSWMEGMAKAYSKGPIIIDSTFGTNNLMVRQYQFFSSGCNRDSHCHPVLPTVSSPHYHGDG